MEKRKKNFNRVNEQETNISASNRKFVSEPESLETNPNIDADGYGSESARSDHSQYSAGLGSRSGNNAANPSQYGSRGRNYYGESGQGSSGRSA